MAGFLLEYMAGFVGIRTMAEKVAYAESLESENRDLKALNAAADERIARLTSILKALERDASASARKSGG